MTDLSLLPRGAVLQGRRASGGRASRGQDIRDRRAWEQVHIDQYSQGGI